MSKKNRERLLVGGFLLALFAVAFAVSFIQGS